MYSIYKRRFIVLFSILLAIAGIILLNYTFRGFTEDIIEERDQQLFNLAVSIDNSLTHEISELKDEFSYSIAQKDYQLAEDDFLTSGDTSGLEQCLYIPNTDIEKCIVGILLTTEEDSQIIYNHDLSGPFTILEDHDGDIFEVCKDENENYYPAFNIPSQTAGISYHILLNFDQFYRNIVPESLWEKNWIVFYDKESGLTTQNHENQPTYLVMSQEEILERNDGYTIIMENELANQRGAKTYQYVNYYEKLVEERIITLPSCETKNGALAIGISRDSEDLYRNIRSRRNQLILFMSVLIFLGIIVVSIEQARHFREAELKNKMEHLKKENELTKQLTEAQIQNSVHQMQPHFLFNALSSIRELIQDSPEYASTMLYDLTQHLRVCIRSMGSSEPIPFAEEIKNIEAYLNIEKMRLEDRLHVVWDIEDTDFEVLPLSIQPLVENAIRHGICKKRGKRGTVTISSRRTDTSHEITVTDDGIGFDYDAVMKEISEHKRDSYGINNIIFRLEQSINASFTIDTSPGQGTTAKVSIPIAEKS